MHKSVCIIVLFAVSAYRANELEFHRTMLLKCRNLSGIKEGSMEYNRENFGTSRESTCFMACLDYEQNSSGPEKWNKDGSLNLEKTIAAINKVRQNLGEAETDYYIYVARQCSHTAAVDYCGKIFDTVTCLRHGMEIQSARHVRLRSIVY